nr:MAG TPA: hypothetical protein [Caudoviricetes sp.]
MRVLLRATDICGAFEPKKQLVLKKFFWTISLP